MLDRRGKPVYFVPKYNAQSHPPSKLICPQMKHTESQVVSWQVRAGVLLNTSTSGNRCRVAH